MSLESVLLRQSAGGALPFTARATLVLAVLLLASSAAYAGVQIEVTFAGNTYTGTTDSNGIFRTTWIRNLSSGTHYAEAVDLVFVGHDWDQDLGWSEDYDGDGFPDGLLPIA